MQINRSYNCDIVLDRNDISVIIYFFNRNCNKKAITQLALKTIDNIMQIVNNLFMNLHKRSCVLASIKGKIKYKISLSFW